MKKSIESLLHTPTVKQGNSDTSRAIIFSLKKPGDRAAIKKLFQKGKIQKVVDSYEEQLKELLEIKNPLNLAIDKKHRKSDEGGVWIYYPWNSSLVHTLAKKDFHRVRTTRNQNIITQQEQQKLGKAKIGITGLNVGNPAAICLALEGFQQLKLADNDILSLSNLNRFRAGLHQIGMNKTYLTAQQVLEINPFVHLEIFPEGITPKNLESFFAKPKIDILIEEMDNLKLKISIRETARKLRIPVVMVTGNAENIILDIERYDKNPNLPLLNGYLKDSVVKKIDQIDPKTSTKRQRALLARDFIESKYLTKRLRQSFLQVGLELGGIPQIAEASFLRGAVLCYVIRQIVLNFRAPSGRYAINLDHIF